MLSLSPIKLVLIVAIALIVLGPDKLPEVARQIGSFWNSLKSWQSRIEEEVRDVVPDLPSTADIARVVRSPVHLLNQLADKVAPVEDDQPVQPGTVVNDTGSEPVAAGERVGPAPGDAAAVEPVETIETAEFVAPPVKHISSADPSLN
jgi:sec-independent protein translocase protein TatB